MKSTRAQILDEAALCILNDRNAAHGEPEDTFPIITRLWDTYLSARGYTLHSGLLQAHDVAAMMVLFKIARHSSNPKLRDNAVDAVGYAAIMGELATLGTPILEG